MNDWKVPVVVDSVVDFSISLMLRCIYYYIDIEDATAMRIADSHDMGRQALVMGGREIILSPSRDRSVFHSLKSIEDFIAAVGRKIKV